MKLKIEYFNTGNHKNSIMEFPDTTGGYTEEDVTRLIRNIIWLMHHTEGTGLTSWLFKILPPIFEDMKKQL